MTRAKKIEKHILKVLTGIEWSILRALIDLYPEFRIREEAKFSPLNPNVVKFNMLVPKDLDKHFGLKTAAFWVFVNGLLEKGFIVRKWKTEKGLAVQLDMMKIDEYADGVPGRTTWKTRIKGALVAVSQFVRRVVTWKRK